MRQVQSCLAHRMTWLPLTTRENGVEWPNHDKIMRTSSTQILTAIFTWRLCVRLRSVINTTREICRSKAQIRNAFVPLTGLICAFRSADFLRWCLSSSERTHAQSLFVINQGGHLWACAHYSGISFFFVQNFV